METNFDLKNRNQNFEIYTIDSDFMVRIWDCAFGEDLISNAAEKTPGKCKQSVILQPCDRYEALMDDQDQFKNELANGNTFLGGLVRNIKSAAIKSEEHGSKIIAVCDNSGVM